MENNKQLYSVNNGIEQYIMTVSKDEFSEMYKLTVKNRNKTYFIFICILIAFGILSVPLNKSVSIAMFSACLFFVIILIAGNQSVKRQWVKKSGTVENRQYLIDIFSDKLSISTIENNELINKYSMYFENIVSSIQNNEFVLLSDEIELLFIRKSLLPSDSILTNVFVTVADKNKKIYKLNAITHVSYIITILMSGFVYFNFDNLVVYTGNPSLWLYFLVLPFSITLTIFSLALKKRKVKWLWTFIFGILFTVLSLINGLGQFGYNKFYDCSYNVISETEKRIGIEIPVPDYIKFYKDDLNDDARINIINEVNMEFSDQEYVQTDINYVEKIISYDVWLKGIPDEFLKIVPYPDYFAESEYSVLFNVDTEEINKIPTESGTHRLVIIAYYYGTLDIVEYTITI